MQINTGAACHTKNYTQGRTANIKYIVIHYTGNDGDTALNNINYFAKNAVSASAHYFVDANGIYQCVADKNTAYHCGTSGTYYHDKCRNSNSIGIEMCDFTSVNDAVRANTVELVRYLMDKYNIGVDCVVRHYDVTHKNCPAPFVQDESAWEDFKNLLIGGIDMATAEELQAQIDELKASQETVYHYTVDLPDWGKSTIQKLLDKGYYSGASDSDLDLPETLLRTLVINDRAGIYGE